MVTNPFVWAVLALGVGIFAGYLLRQTVAKRQANSAEQKIKNWLDEAKTQAKEVVLDAKDRAAKLLEEVKSDEKVRALQLDKLQEILLRKNWDWRKAKKSCNWERRKRMSCGRRFLKNWKESEH